MKANEAIGRMLGSACLSQSEAARRLGLSRQSVSSDVKGHVDTGRQHGMTVGKLLAYADLCGYGLRLVPDDPSMPHISVDGVNRGGRRPAAGRQ